MAVNPEVARVIKEFHAAGKPMALCCIAPILAAKVLGSNVSKPSIFQSILITVVVTPVVPISAKLNHQVAPGHQMAFGHLRPPGQIYWSLKHPLVDSFGNMANLKPDGLQSWGGLMEDWGRAGG